MTEGFTAEQVDFEESQLENDTHRVKQSWKGKDAAKLQRADQKSFETRGFHGHTKKLEGAARREAMKVIARRTRVQTGSEGVSKKQRTFMQEEGLWRNPRPRPVRRQHRGAIPVERVFQLKPAVARFKRMGDLPNVTIAVVEAADASGVDGRALHRMILAMQARAGIEPNPGPEADDFGNPVCRYAGQRIQGERFESHGRRFLICPACTAKLTGINRKLNPLMGDHPGAVAIPAQVPPPPPQVPPVPAVLMPAPAPAPAPAPLEVVQAVEAPVPAPPPPPEVVAQAPPPVVVPPKPEKLPEVEHTLRGCNISHEDVAAVMSRVCGHEVDYEDIAVRKSLFRTLGNGVLQSIVVFRR